MKTTLRLITCVLLSFCFVTLFAQTTATAPTGTGTEAAPYEIATYANLLWLSATPAEWAAGKYFVQTADIVVADDETAKLNPIGNDYYLITDDELTVVTPPAPGVRTDYTMTPTPFKGSYDGQGKKITNLTVYFQEVTTGEAPSTITSAAIGYGLFGVVEDATIKNVILEGMNIDITGLYFEDDMISVGGVAGIAKGTTTISGVAMTLKATPGVDAAPTTYSGEIKYDFTATANVGGLVGSLAAELTDSYFSGSFDANTIAGGLVGYVTTDASIANCYVAASIILATDVAFVIFNTSEDDADDIDYITGVYYDNELGTAKAFAAEVAGADPVAVTGITGKTTNEMKNDIDTYVDWAFPASWIIHSDINDGYPQIRAAVNVVTEAPTVATGVSFEDKVAIKFTALDLGTPATADGNDLGEVIGYNVYCDDELVSEGLVTNFYGDVADGNIFCFEHVNYTEGNYTYAIATVYDFYGQEEESALKTFTVAVKNVAITLGTAGYAENFDATPAGWHTYYNDAFGNSMWMNTTYLNTAGSDLAMRITQPTDGDWLVSPFFTLPEAPVTPPAITRTGQNLYVEFDLALTNASDATAIGTLANDYQLLIMVSEDAVDCEDAFFSDAEENIIAYWAYFPESTDPEDHPIGRDGEGNDDEDGEVELPEYLDFRTIATAGQTVRLSLDEFAGKTVKIAFVIASESYVMQKPRAAEMALFVNNFKVVAADPSSDIEVVVPFAQNALHANYPNPFNPETTISFSLAKDSNVTVDVYNVKGQKVKTLANDRYTSGNHKVVWNGIDEAGRNVSSGVYFYRMKTDSHSEVKKMILMK